MLDKIKMSLRISSNDFDAELLTLLNACLSELRLNGVDVTNSQYEDLVQLAVNNFCKTHFGCNEKADQYNKMYNSLKSYLMTACKVIGYGD